MTTLLQLINDGDLCALPILILLLYLVGLAMAGSDTRLQLWGKRTAGAAFVLYAVYALFFETYV